MTATFEPFQATKIMLLNSIMAENLAHIDRLPRRALMRFLAVEKTKANTQQLRSRARLAAIAADTVQVALDLARIEKEVGR